MPAVESFALDHTKVKAPYVRVAGYERHKLGSVVQKFDVRFMQPNAAAIPTAALHTLEHLLAYGLREELAGVIDISPMGCRTGFYMSLIGTPDEQQVADAWLAAMQDVLDVQNQSQIPELNEYQCGTYQMHSLGEAQQIAENILKRKVAVNKNEDLTLDEDLLNA